MPYRVVLIRKDASQVRGDFRIFHGQTPKMNDVIDYDLDGQVIKARVTDIRSSPPKFTDAAVGTVHEVEAQEI